MMKIIKEKSLVFISVHIGIFEIFFLKFYRFIFSVGALLVVDLHQPLLNFYKTHSKEKNFEIIFISSDRDEKAFNEYYKDMPWLTLIYSERKKKEELGPKNFILLVFQQYFYLMEIQEILFVKMQEIKFNIKIQRGESFPWKSL